MHESLLDPLLAFFTSRRTPPNSLLPTTLRILLDTIFGIIILKNEPSCVVVAVLVSSNIYGSLNLRLTYIIISLVVGGVIQLDLHVVGVIIFLRVTIRLTFLTILRINKI